MYRRAFLREHGLSYDPQYENAEDYDFILALLREKPSVAMLEYPVYCYRLHPGQQHCLPSERANAERIRSKWLQER
jgi:hypothetical protein